MAFPRRRKFTRKRRPMKRKRFVRKGRHHRYQVTQTQPVASRVVAHLRYAESFATAHTANVPNYQFYNANSIFDPNRTGVGHQPFGRDTYATLYNRYRVFALSYAIDCASATASLMALSVGVMNHVNTPANWDAGIEQPRVITKTISSTGSSCTIHGKVWLPKVNGATSTQYRANEDTAALMSADPTENIVLRIGTLCYNNATPVYNVRLTYHTEMWDPIELGQS